MNTQNQQFRQTGISNARCLADLGPTTPQPFLSQRESCTSSIVSVKKRSSEVRSVFRVTPQQCVRSTDSPSATTLSRIPSISSALRVRSRTSSLCVSSTLRKGPKTFEDSANADDGSALRARGRALGLTSPRANRPPQRAKSQVIGPRKSFGAPDTPAASGLSRQTSVMRNRVPNVVTSAVRRGQSATGNNAIGSASRARKDTDVGSAANLVSTKSGSFVNVSNATTVTSSSRRSFSTQRNANRFLSSASRRFYRDHINAFSDTFENITLDPTKFSSEKVRRDAASVILRYLCMKNYPHPISQQDLVHCPSTQLYITLMQFLFNHVDSTTEPFILDEKVTSMFKILGYPLQFAKSHFRSPCTPLMWPQHLASIAWLCALLIFNETVLYEIACPVTRDSATETVQCAAQTPRVIGGGRALFDELRNADERSEPAGGLPLPKSPLGITPLKAELLGALDPVPTEPITVALVRTIQNAYMLHRQQGKEVDEEDLARLLDADLAKFKAKEEALMQDALTLRDAAKEAYEIEKTKLNDIGNLQVQTAQHLSDIGRFEARIQTTEKLIQDKKRRTETLKAESASRALQILDLQQQVDELSSKVSAQGVSKEEAQMLTEKTLFQRKRLEEKQKDVAAAQAEWLSLNNLLDQLKERIESTTQNSSQILSSLRNDQQTYRLASLTGSAAHFDFPPALTVTLSFLTDDRVKNLCMKNCDSTSLHRCFRELDCDLGSSPESVSAASRELSRDGTLAAQISPQMRSEIEEVLRTVCQGVSWSQLKLQFRNVIQAEVSAFKNIQQKIEDYRKVRVTVEKAIQMKLRKIAILRDEAESLSAALTLKKKNQEAELKQQQQKLEITDLDSREELERLKKENQQLQKALAEARRRKQEAFKLLRSTEQKGAERLSMWSEAMKKEAETLSSKLTEAKKLVLRENKNLEVLLYINKKSFSYARDVFKRRSLESADVTTGLSSWNSNEKSKGLLPHLLGSPGVEQKLL